MYKLDLHTHSVASPDGSISPEQYAHALESELLDYIAITDHDRIDFAVGMQRALGDRIIIGEEIMTPSGEIIGLFLNELVPPGLPPLETVQLIQAQGGLVYVPHPFEHVRSGLDEQTLAELVNFVDIMEIFNGRALRQKLGPKAAAWAKINSKAGAASSDAHGARGLGHSYSIVNEPPTQFNLIDLLSLARVNSQRAPLHTLLYPKLNRIRKKVKRS